MFDLSMALQAVVADPGDGWGHMGDWAGPMIGFGWVLLLLVVTAARDVSARRSGHRSSLDILEERFARGEIDRNEFRDRREELLT